MASRESLPKCMFTSLIQKLRGRIPHLVVQPSQADTLWSLPLVSPYVSTTVTCPCSTSKDMVSRWEWLCGWHCPLWRSSTVAGHARALWLDPRTVCPSCPPCQLTWPLPQLASRLLSIPQFFMDSSFVISEGGPREGPREWGRSPGAHTVR